MMKLLGIIFTNQLGLHGTVSAPVPWRNGRMVALLMKDSTFTVLKGWRLSVRLLYLEFPKYCLLLCIFKKFDWFAIRQALKDSQPQREAQVSILPLSCIIDLPYANSLLGYSKLYFFPLSYWDAFYWLEEIDHIEIARELRVGNGYEVYLRWPWGESSTSFPAKSDFSVYSASSFCSSKQIWVRGAMKPRNSGGLDAPESELTQSLLNH